MECARDGEEGTGYGGTFHRTRVPSFPRSRVPAFLRPTAGFALLEVLVSLTILASAGLALVGIVQSALRYEVAAQREEETIAKANRVLTAMTLLTRQDLDQRLGHHEVGEFEVSVQRPEPTLYRLAIAERGNEGTRERGNGGTRERGNAGTGNVPERELLVTVVYRAEVGP